jgi:hypothetical protein
VIKEKCMENFACEECEFNYCLNVIKQPCTLYIDFPCRHDAPFKEQVRKMREEREQKRIDEKCVV